MDRRAGRDADVDARMERPPAHAERARDRARRAATRSRVPRRRPRRRSSRLRRPPPAPRRRGASRRAARSPPASACDSWISSCTCLRVTTSAWLLLERAPASLLLAREQLAAQDRLLLHARVDHVRLLLHAVLAPSSSARAARLICRFAVATCAATCLSCARDRAEVVELVEHVVEAPRGEQHVDRRRLVLLVDRRRGGDRGAAARACTRARR